jgi:hypothetical protein
MVSDDQNQIRKSRDNSSAATNIRVYAEPGRAFQAPWVVYDRQRNIVAEFDRRKDAQNYVREVNRGR